MGRCTGHSIAGIIQHQTMRTVRVKRTRSGHRVSRQFLKDHLLDFEVGAALCIASLLKFGFGVNWFVSVVSGVSAFVFIPLLLRVAFHIRAIYFMRLFK